MKAVLVNGSPRKKGNTEYLLRRCEDKFKDNGIDTEMILLAGKELKACIGCGGCRRVQNNSCLLKGDDFQEIYNSIVTSDIIVVGSPVYFGSATSQITSLLDRVGYVQRSNGSPLSRKIGAPVVVARRAGQNFTYAQLVYWYTINDMMLAGSTYWSIAFGREKGEVEDDKEGVETVGRLADNLIWMGRKLFS